MIPVPGGLRDGGLSENKPADPELLNIVKNFKADVEKAAGVRASEFKIVSYKSQVVAGMNYFVKVHIGNQNYAHLRIYKPLPHTGLPPRLSALEVGKTLADPVDYFN